MKYLVGSSGLSYIKGAISTAKWKVYTCVMIVQCNEQQVWSNVYCASL